MKIYDPSQVSVLIGGAIIKSWDLVKVSRDEDGYTFYTGTQGESTRIKNLNKMGAIELTLPQSSSDNDILTGKQIAGDLITCAIMDKSGTTVITMPSGTIVKMPDVELGEENTQRVWLIKGDTPDPYMVGGNA